MSIERECVGLSPHQKLPVIAHARICIWDSEVSPSFPESRNPSNVHVSHSKSDGPWLEAGSL
jgi:hypothetical protein